MPHDLSIALHIFGQVPTPRAASGRMISSRRAEMRAELVDVNGAVVYIDVSSLRPVNRRMIALVCENGSVELGGSYDEEVILCYTSGEAATIQERLKLPKKMPLETELQCFLDYLLGGPPPMSTAAEGLAVIEAIVDLRRIAALA
jgi:predicted dehydrogenase